MIVALLIVLVVFLATAFGILAYRHLNLISELDNDEPLDVQESTRKINLSCGDGYCHPDACCALSGLRSSGWDVTKVGGKNGGGFTLYLYPPPKGK